MLTFVRTDQTEKTAQCLALLETVSYCYTVKLNFVSKGYINMGKEREGQFVMPPFS